MSAYLIETGNKSGKRVVRQREGSPAEASSERPASDGGLAVKVTRPAPDVAFIETSSSVHWECFWVAEGEHTLVVGAFDHGDKSTPEPRIHVINKPYGWSMQPSDDPPSAGDDQELLVQVWQLLSSN